MNCNHEEAETRLIVHTLHALEQVLKRIDGCTIDTDVIVIHVGAFVKPTRGKPLDNIWVAFGIDKDLKFYSINAICATLGDSNFQYSINYNWLWHHIIIHRKGKKCHHGKLGRHMK